MTLLAKLGEMVKRPVLDVPEVPPPPQPDKKARIRQVQGELARANRGSDEALKARLSAELEALL